MADVLQEFLVSLKYTVDAASQQTFLGALKRAATSMTGIAAEAALLTTAILEMAHSMAEAGEKLYFMSQRLGMSIGDIKAATYAMTQFGISTADAQGSIEAFGNMQRSYGPAMTAFLRNFGITATDTAGRLDQLGVFFRRMGGTLENASSNSLQYAWIKQFAESLGISERVMQEMASDENQQRIREYNQLLERAGLDTKAWGEQSHQLMSAFRQLNTIFDVLWMTMGKSLFPSLTNDLNRLYKLLYDHLPALQKIVTAVADVFAFWFRSIVNVTEALFDFADSVANLVHALPAGFDQLGEAIAAFSLLLIRSPLFWFIAGLSTLLVLLDDFKVWQKGGKSEWDWSWTKDIDKFMKDTLGLKGGFGDLLGLLAAVIVFIPPILRLARSIGLIGTAATVAAGKVGLLRSALRFAIFAELGWELGKIAGDFAHWLAKQIYGENSEGGPGHTPYTVGDLVTGKPRPPAAGVGAGIGGAAGAGVLGGGSSPLSGAPEPMQPINPSLPRNERNYNPGNLNFANQPGAVLESGPNTRFARFPNMVAGVAAMVQQIQRDFNVYGQTTLRTLIQGKFNPRTGKYEHGWAPAGDNNDVEAYIGRLARQTGLNPDTPFNPNDPSTLERLGQAITRVEGGRGLDPATMTAGVQRALGTGPILPAGVAATPTQAQTGGRGGAVINQSTSIHVAPGPTAGATARAVADQQGRVNEALVRNTAGVLR